MAEASAANINTRSGPNHGPHPQPSGAGGTGAARPLPLSSATGREASLQRSWLQLQRRAVQVIFAPKQGSGMSMPGKAGAGAQLGNVQLG